MASVLWILFCLFAHFYESKGQTLCNSFDDVALCEWYKNNGWCSGSCRDNSNIPCVNIQVDQTCKQYNPTQCVNFEDWGYCDKHCGRCIDNSGTTSSTASVTASTTASTTTTTQSTTLPTIASITTATQASSGPCVDNYGESYCQNFISQLDCDQYFDGGGCEKRCGRCTVSTTTSAPGACKNRWSNQRCRRFEPIECSWGLDNGRCDKWCKRCAVTKSTTTTTTTTTTTPIPKIPTPTNVRAPVPTITQNAIQIRWDAVAGAESYHVKVTPSNGVVGAGGGITNPYTTLTNLQPDTSYLVQVASQNEGGLSEYADVTAKTKLATPTNVRAPVPTITQNAIQIRWNAVAGAESYHVKVTPSNAVVGAGAGITNPYTTLTNLQPDTSYFVQVAARNEGGLSKYADVTAKTKPVPTTASTTTQSTAPSGPVFNKWTACSTQCGLGTQYNVSKCEANNIETCPRTYQECNSEKPCPEKSCKNYRYRSLTACCTPPPKGNLVSRIIGGRKAKKWPFMTRLEILFSGTTYKCGGMIIHDYWVLTAAHCLGFPNLKPSALKIYYDTNNNTGGQMRIVDKFIIHEKYADNLNDIALIKVTVRFSSSAVIVPICLPREEKTAEDLKCLAMGWGITETGKVSEALLEVDLYNLPTRVCKDKYPSWQVNVQADKHLCFGKLSGGSDTCTGDSGGPLICQRANSCQWYVSGVVSFGPIDCGVANYPAVYTNVVTYEPWIKKHIPALKQDITACGF